MSEEEIHPAIPYATPEPRRPSKTWAATALLFGGLGLIFLGGCFLIGVMMLSQPISMAGLDAPKILLTCLVILAVGCFFGAIPLIVLGAKSLLQIIRT